MELREDKKMKLTMNDLRNITPVGVNVNLKYEEGYNGDEKELTIRVYPLTVEEKISLQERSDKLNKLLRVKERSDEQEAEMLELNNDINLDYAYYTTKKVVPDITREFIKETFPKIWFNQIFKATLEAEGISAADIEKEKN